MKNVDETVEEEDDGLLVDEVGVLDVEVEATGETGKIAEASEDYGMNKGRQATDFITFNDWDEIDAACYPTYTYEYAVLTCPSKQEVRSTTFPEEPPIVISSNLPHTHNHGTFIKQPRSSHFYSIGHPERFEYKIYEVTISQARGDEAGEIVQNSTEVATLTA